MAYETPDYPDLILLMPDEWRELDSGRVAITVTQIQVQPSTRTATFMGPRRYATGNDKIVVSLDESSPYAKLAELDACPLHTELIQQKYYELTGEHLLLVDPK